MNNETEKNQSKQEQGQQAPAGSITSDTKGTPSPENQSQSHPTQDLSKKNPPQGTDSEHPGQEKTEDEKRRAS